MQAILEVILSLQNFIFFCVAILLPFCGVLLLLARNFRWKRKSSAFVGLFYHMSLSSMAYLACSLLLFLLMSWMILWQTINLTTMMAYLILLIFSTVLHPNPKKIPIVLINGLLSGMAYYFAQVLLGYSQLIQMNENLVLIYYFLGIFVILYNFYYFLRALQDVSHVRSFKGESKEGEL